MASTGATLAVFRPEHNENREGSAPFLARRNGHPVLKFDDTTQWSAVFTGVVPKSYIGGDIIVAVHWTAQDAVTGTGGWDVTFERCADAGQDIDSTGWATAQTITADNVDAASGKVNATSVTCTAGATGTDSVAVGDLFRLRVRRDVANDTAVGYLELLAVEAREADVA